MFRAFLLLSVAVSMPAWADDLLAHQSISALEKQIASGKLTSEALVRYDLNRIHELDRAGPAIHAVIAINPDAIRFSSCEIDWCASESSDNAGMDTTTSSRSSARDIFELDHS